MDRVADERLDWMRAVEFNLMALDPIMDEQARQPEKRPRNDPGGDPIDELVGHRRSTENRNGV